MLKHDRFSAEYYWSTTRGPVQFTGAIQRMIHDINTPSFLEIGPHPALAGYLVTLGGETATVICPLRRPKGNQGEVVSASTSMFSMDAPQQTSQNYPPTPFPARSSSSSQRAVELFSASYQLADAPLPGSTCDPRQAHPCLPQALEFGARQFWDINFSFMLSLSGDQPVPVDVSIEGPRWSVRSAFGAPPQFDCLRADGYLSLDSQWSTLPAVDIQAIKARCTQASVEGFYEGFEHFAMTKH
ncbi:hypothetical protein DEU56DRAFT_909186 [Suillus clintonianus]|uniref:uncharacterized protein n=1 Tax=Suillus clintonianus TaxID=1904413 RepID=UPI001B86EC2D|nr:uncharacterized protein DEU56DRAFT_909186 [Suillus clintonianus]KAG2148876.1 hypothetical protein DEU56DRAFT_909186 [Suillus clintonianus]